MERIELKEKLTEENFIFINKLVVMIGGKKRGTKTQDIEEILEIWETQPKTVESALETMLLNKENRGKNFIEFVSNIKDLWNLVLGKIEKLEDVGEDVLDAVDRIDSFFKIFKKK